MAHSEFQNRKGERVAMQAFTATEAKNEFGRVLDTAIERGAVTITRHDSPKAVLLAVGEYDALVAAGRTTLDALTVEFDGLLAGMQTPKARRGMADAFDAKPARLGKAARRAAKKRG